MTYEKYIAEYRKFLDQWQAVKNRNEIGDYSLGCAIYGTSCDKIVVFDNEEQKQNYKAVFC